MTTIAEATSATNTPSWTASNLCDTARLLATVMSGARERSVLAADDGTVLYMNGAAVYWLYVPDDGNGRSPHITDFLVIPPEKDWRCDVDHCRMVMKDGKTTRSERHTDVKALEPCACCRHRYYSIHISSKHERVREVVDHALDPVLTCDERGIIVTANDAATELFGYPESELVGHNVSLICGGGHASSHDQYIQNYLETGIPKAIGKRREVLGRKRDGTEFPCEMALQEISDASSGKRYFCGYLKDLTKIKQHEAELQEQQQRAQGMIDASFDSMFEVDQAGIITVVNNAACSMFGYTRDEFLGSNISMICGGGHAEKHNQYMQRYVNGGEKHIIGRKRQVPAKRKDGSEIEVELGVQEVTLSNGQKAFCGYMRDLTQQKKDKRELQRQKQLIHGKFFSKEGIDDAEEGGEQQQRQRRSLRKQK